MSCTFDFRLLKYHVLALNMGVVHISCFLQATVHTKFMKKYPQLLTYLEDMVEGKGYFVGESVSVYVYHVINVN